LGNSTAFQTTLVKGLYITTENTAFTPGSGDGNILHFKMEDVQTKMILFYHNDSLTGLTYDLSLGSVSRFVKFKHDHSIGDSYFQSQLNGTSTVDTSVFIQAMAGTKVKIEFPYLKNMNDSGKVSVNKAQLVIKVDDSNPLYKLDTFAAPLKLVLFGINENNLNYVIPDSYESNETIDGSYNKLDHLYYFNIERYVQQVLNGNLSNTGLHMIVSGGAINANRVVIGGGKNTGPLKMKLNLTFTKIH
jgi:hypothetical protein